MVVEGVVVVVVLVALPGVLFIALKGECVTLEGQLIIAIVSLWLKMLLFSFASKGTRLLTPVVVVVRRRLFKVCFLNGT